MKFLRLTYVKKINVLKIFALLLITMQKIDFIVKVYRPIGFHSDHDPVSSTLTW